MGQRGLLLPLTHRPAGQTEEAQNPPAAPTHTIFLCYGLWVGFRAAGGVMKVRGFVLPILQQLDSRIQLD